MRAIVGRNWWQESLGKIASLIKFLRVKTSFLPQGKSHFGRDESIIVSRNCRIVFVAEFASEPVASTVASAKAARSGT
jgi:hypothetical protein